MDITKNVLFGKSSCQFLFFYEPSDGDHIADISILKLLVVNGFFIFLMIQKDTFIKSKLEHYLFNSIFLGLLIFNVFSHFADVSRLAQYFLMAEIILVPIYLHQLQNIYWQRALLLLFLVYYLFNFNYALYRDINAPGTRPHFLVPYKNYFFESSKSHRTMNLDAWYYYILENTTNEIPEEEEK